MCGVAGFDGIKNSQARSVLAMALAIGIDARGGDSLGGAMWVRGARKVVRALGRWDGVQGEILDSLMSAQTAMLHARMATMGKVSLENAHPFTIKRSGRRALIGAHNGVIDAADVRASARRHGREVTVDSREAFELLADGALDELRALRGYGVLTWVVPEERRRCVRIVRATSDGALCVKSVVGGGIVYASTERILDGALHAAGLEAEDEYRTDVGVVYQVRDGALWVDADWQGKPVTFADRWERTASRWTSHRWYRHGAWTDGDDDGLRSEYSLSRDVSSRVDWRRLYQDAVDGDATGDDTVGDGATSEDTGNGKHETQFMNQLTDDEADMWLNDPLFDSWELSDFLAFVRRNRLPNGGA